MAPDEASVADALAFVDELAQLQSPRGRRLPRLVIRLLPQPLRSAEDLARLRHEDVPCLTNDQARHELARLSVGLGWIDDVRDVPLWIPDRRGRLGAHIRLLETNGKA